VATDCKARPTKKAGIAERSARLSAPISRMPSAGPVTGNLPFRDTGNACRITTTVDAWGIPSLKIHCAFGENELAIRKDMAIAGAEMLAAAGAISIQPFQDDDPPGFSVHEMGTARMGRDPKTSVLNAWNQAHDIKNLFITDGSCMTSSGCVNPSLTYMALTARACDYAVDQLKRGEL